MNLESRNEELNSNDICHQPIKQMGKNQIWGGNDYFCKVWGSAFQNLIYPLTFYVLRKFELEG